MDIVEEYVVGCCKIEMFNSGTSVERRVARSG